MSKNRKQYKINYFGISGPEIVSAKNGDRSMALYPSMTKAAETVIGNLRASIKATHELISTFRKYLRRKKENQCRVTCECTCHGEADRCHYGERKVDSWECVHYFQDYINELDRCTNTSAQDDELESQR